ncbi:MAG TPA: glycosyl hydrolase, partial [Acidobacteriota bacterium]|nr:glycosyl hydrolase [Acidobacteriota bacterium]
MFRVSIILPFFAIAQTATMWPAEPVSPNATPEAKRILEYLSRLPGRYDHRIVSGRHLSAVETEPLADPDARPRSDLRNRVGMISLMYSSPARISGAPAALSRSHLNRILIDYWKAGGLVTLSFEGRNPWTGGDARDVNRGDLSELVTPGTEANAAWLKELDSVAKDLTELRDAGVVVLWRPFPSVNGDWFWWGQREPEAFQKDKFVDLWRHMFEYFTQVKHLNNLLWVYSADSSVHRRMSVTAYFPGQEYCDIVGMDCYSSDIIWDGYNNMVRLGKPFGATAVGPSKGTPDMLDVDRLMARVRFWYPLTTYFVASADGFAADSLDGPGLSKDPWVISREDLAWKITTRRRWQQNAKLAINRVELLTKHPVCWKRLDVRIDLSATFETPFDAAQIQVDAHVATPSGRIMEVPAFFDQPFERQVWGGGHYSEEAMVEAGPPEWRVRFMPGQAGKYSVTIRARDGSGSVQSPPLTFSAETAPGPGYIRVSRKDPHYFEFDDGEPFFAIGMNIAEHPLSEYYRYILRLSQNGGNFSRLWIGSEYFGLELGRMGDYRLDNAWRLDQVMELSERLGIYQELCIDWVRHITSRGEPRRGFDPEDYAYSTSNGGPCAGMSDFFTLPEAPRLFKNRLRYIVARWGYSPNVMAWELWNEIDLIDPKARRVSAIVSWNEEMCRYLKSIDPWQHLTTNSLAGRSMGPALWSLTENEFAQRHGYSTPTPQNVLTSVD